MTTPTKPTDTVQAARARWNQLDMAAKQHHAETETWINQQLADFDAKNGRTPHPGDPIFSAIDTRLNERDRLRAEADNARAGLDLFVRAREVTAYAGDLAAGGTLGVGRPSAAATALVEQLQASPSLASQPSFSAQLPSLIASFLNSGNPGGMRPQAAFDGGGSGSSGVYTEHGILEIPGRKRVILDLLGPGTPIQSLGGEVVNYLRQTVRTINANVVEPLADKPVSVITIDRAATEIFTVAHLTEQLPLQLLTAFPELMPFVDQTMSAGLMEKLENLVVNGTGAGAQPTGIANASGINTLPLGAYTRLGAIRRALTVFELQNIIPDAAVFAPQDFQDLELETDGDGRFLVGDPTGSAPANVWRMRAVSSTALNPGTVIVGNFRLGTKWWDGVSKLLFTQIVGDDLKQNAVRCLAEQGFGFAVTRPSYFLTITGF